jgi:hypothetical protein
VTPAVERAGLRIDVGFPLGSNPGIPPYDVEVAFGQAFDVGGLGAVGPPPL